MRWLVVAAAAGAALTLALRGRGSVQWGTSDGLWALPAVLPADRELVAKAKEAIRSA